MPPKRLSMRRIREVLRLRSEGRTVREIAQSVGIGQATAWGYLGRAKVAGIAWPLPEEVDEAASGLGGDPHGAPTQARHACAPVGGVQEEHPDG